ncbi:MAG: insulinase family protein, partial [Clostridia bacterium]|nr:insulinase family protein [Clostridia bacterium]
MNNSKLITFKNGLRLEFVTKPQNMVQATFKVAFMVGSEDEKKEEGLAHLLEHCMFKGTKEYTQEQLSIELDKICAMPNASTSAEFTIYEAKFPKFNIESLIELFSKMIFESTFDESGIENEKLVVIEEIKMHNDVPSDCAFDQLTNTMYAGTGLGFDIAGDEKLLKKLTRQDLIDFRNTHYIPENTIISVVGDFDEKIIMELIEKYFASRFCEINSALKEQKKWTQEVHNKPQVVVKNKKINQANVMMGAYTTGYGHP